MNEQSNHQMSDTSTMSQASVPPKKSPAVRPGFIAILSALFLAAGITAAVIFWVIPAVEKAQDDAKYDSVAGFAESYDQLDPHIADSYDVMNKVLPQVKDRIEGVMLDPLLFLRSDTKPKPSDRTQFALNEDIHLDSEAAAQKTAELYKDEYLAKGYVLIKESERGFFLERKDGQNNSTDSVSISLMNSQRNPGNKVYIMNVVGEVALSGAPAMAGQFTNGERAKIPYTTCDETTTDGITFSNPNGAWLEGYGCIEDYA